MQTLKLLEFGLLLSINLCCGENYIVIGIYPKGSDIKTPDFDTNY